MSTTRALRSICNIALQHNPGDAARRPTTLVPGTTRGAISQAGSSHTRGQDDFAHSRIRVITPGLRGKPTKYHMRSIDAVRTGACAYRINISAITSSSQTPPIPHPQPAPGLERRRAWFWLRNASHGAPDVLSRLGMRGKASEFGGLINRRGSCCG